ncbi:MAG: hypothetical protein NTW94_03085 [Legionellales bacterium]|nr:hypothetical protein [Legionellales bacterium]
MPIKLLKKVATSAKKTGMRLVDRAEDIINPCVGDSFQKLTRNVYALRLDGRLPSEIAATKGFVARISPDDVRTLRRDRIEHYQSSNEQPFALGCCALCSDLFQGYVEGNPAAANKRTLFGLVTPAVSLLELRVEALHETGTRDYEKEFMVTERVPIKHFLFANSPPYRAALISGADVSNEISHLNSTFDLPKQFNLKDIEDIGSILRWLLAHNAENAARFVSSFLFSPSLSRDCLSHHLGGDKLLVGIIQSFLQGSKEPVDEHPERFDFSFRK